MPITGLVMEVVTSKVTIEVNKVTVCSVFHEVEYSWTRLRLGGTQVRARGPQNN